MNIYPKRVVLMRHPQSTLNVAKIHSPVFFKDEAHRAPFIGIPDERADITELGAMQAAQTGKGLVERNYSFDIAYHSGYLRTKKGLEIALGAYPEEVRRKIAVKCSIYLRERECGYSYCLTEEGVKQQFPWLQEYWQTVGPIFARPPGGESIADTIQRVDQFVPRMHQECEGKNVLISLHGRVLAAFRFLYEEWDYDTLGDFVKKGGHKNCGITVYEYCENAKKLVLKEYNTCFWR